MLRNNSYSNGYQREQPANSNDPLSGLLNRLRVFVNNSFKGEMETKLLLGVMYAIGIPSWIWGILLNMGTWKADVLFVISTAITCVYAVFMVRKLIDLDTMRKLNIKKEKREFDREKDEPPPPPEPDNLAKKIDRLNRDDDMFRNMR